MWCYLLLAFILFSFFFLLFWHVLMSLSTKYNLAVMAPHSYLTTLPFLATLELPQISVTLIDVLTAAARRCPLSGEMNVDNIRLIICLLSTQLLFFVWF